tara:strand:- start:27 stop:230 length:204 start_codon:yes stop_codon:yes gene_type:complete
MTDTNTFFVYRHVQRTKPFDFIFQWNNGEEETSIAVALHGAMKLAEQFKALGFKELDGSIKFTSNPF